MSFLVIFVVYSFFYFPVSPFLLAYDTDHRILEEFVELNHSINTMI